MSLGWALCYVIAACEGVGDFSRAAQWCEAMRVRRALERAASSLGVCRSAYGAVLTALRRLGGGGGELTAAVADLDAARPGMAASGLVRLAELRARQGPSTRRATLFERAGTHRARGARPRRARARRRATRRPRRMPQNESFGGFLRSNALRSPPRARAARPRTRRAGRARARRPRPAPSSGARSEQLGTPYLHGRARLVAGELRQARGDHEEARRAYEDAVDCFDEGRSAVRRGARPARAAAGARRARPRRAPRRPRRARRATVRHPRRDTGGRPPPRRRSRRRWRTARFPISRRASSRSSSSWPRA